jgi:hypothetical protein
MYITFVEYMNNSKVADESNSRATHIIHYFCLHTSEWNSNDLSVARVLQETPRLFLLLLLLLILHTSVVIVSLYRECSLKL